MLNKLVLLLEADPAASTQVSEILRGFDCEPVPCSTLAEAVGLLEIRSFRAILADCEIPDDGADHLLSWMRMEKREEPVIMMSHGADYDLLLDMIQKGALDLVSKPVQAAQLKRSLDLALGIHFMTA